MAESIDRGLVIIHHIGTSVQEAIENELQALAADISASTGKDTLLAFSSKRAIHKLARRGIDIPYIEDAIERAVETYSRVSVLPVHLVGGADYLRLFDSFAEIKGSGIHLYEPLLTSERRSMAVAAAIAETKGRDRNILFIGHGTAHHTNEYYDRFLKQYRTLNPNAWFMTLKDPVGEIAEMLPKKVHLIPLFTVCGHHISKDICDGHHAINGKLQKAGKETTLDMEGLLASKRIRELYIDALHDREGRVM